VRQDVDGESAGDVGGALPPNVNCDLDGQSRRLLAVPILSPDQAETWRIRHPCRLRRVRVHRAQPPRVALRVGLRRGAAVGRDRKHPGGPAPSPARTPPARARAPALPRWLVSLHAAAGARSRSVFTPAVGGGVACGASALRIPAA
jgi:hypothetical protein